MGGTSGGAGQPAGTGGTKAELGLCADTPYRVADLPPVGTPGVAYLSDLTEEAGAENGLGPFEKDMSNGLEAAGDGGSLVIAGVCYPKGLGVRAWSNVTYQLGGKYKQLVADTGWDFEAGTQAPIFEVFLDDQLVYDRGEHILPDKDTMVPIAIDVTGKMKLKILLRDGFNDQTKCFAVWGGVRLLE
jgi:alpha-galactosidase